MSTEIRPEPIDNDLDVEHNANREPADSQNELRFAPPSMRPDEDAKPITEVASVDDSGASESVGEEPLNELAYNELNSSRPNLATHPINQRAVIQRESLDELSPLSGEGLQTESESHLVPAESQSPSIRSQPSEHPVPTHYGAAFAADERTDGITLLALYHFGWATLYLLGGFLMAIPTAITGIVGLADDPEIFWVTGFLGTATFFILALSVLFFAVGLGLWRLKQWSRTAAIVIALVSLPTGLGTLPGAATLWYLMKERVSRLFR